MAQFNDVWNKGLFYVETNQCSTVGSNIRFKPNMCLAAWTVILIACRTKLGQLIHVCVGWWHGRLLQSTVAWFQQLPWCIYYASTINQVSYRSRGMYLEREEGRERDERKIRLYERKIRISVLIPTLRFHYLKTPYWKRSVWTGAEFSQPNN